MGMFDDVVINAKAAANAFSKKAGNVFDISKLKFNASSIRGEINKRCQELGEMVFDSKDGKEVSEELINAKFDEIKNLKNDLTAVNELLAAAKNLMICPVCSAVIANDSMFCNKCGTKIQPQNDETQSKQEENADNGTKQESEDNSEVKTEQE